MTCNSQYSESRVKLTDHLQLATTKTYLAFAIMLKSFDFLHAALQTHGPVHILLTYPRLSPSINTLSISCSFNFITDDVNTTPSYPSTSVPKGISLRTTSMLCFVAARQASPLAKGRSLPCYTQRSNFLHSLLRGNKKYG